MRRVGALLDNAQKLHAARRRDISIVHHNEHPSDMIQYFTLRHNRSAHLLSSFIIYRQGNKDANEYRFRHDITACSYILKKDQYCFRRFFVFIRFHSAQGQRAKFSSYIIETK